MKAKNFVLMALVGVLGFSFAASSAHADGDPALNHYIAEKKKEIDADRARIAAVKSLLDVIKGEPKAGMTVAVDAAMIGAGVGIGSPTVAVISLSVVEALSFAIQGATPAGGARGALFSRVDGFAARTVKVEGLSMKIVRGTLKTGGWLAVPCTVVSTGGAVYAALTEAEVAVLKLTIDQLQNAVNYREIAIENFTGEKY